MRGRRGEWLEGMLFVAAAALLVAGNARGVLAPKPYEPAPRTDEVLRVVTWNVGGGLAEGGSALRNDHIDHVVETLRALDADLVLLQEVTGRHQVRELRRGLGDGWESAVDRRGGARRVAVLARTDKLHSFDVDSGGGEQRALGVTFVTAHGTEVVAIGIHANAFSAEVRNAVIGAAVDALHEAARERPDALRILAGDLNLDLDLDKRRDLFTDDAHLDVETYNYVTRSLVDAARGRGATAEPDRRLDYVFIGPDRFEARAAGPWKEKRVGDMDHDPVVADVVTAPAE